MTPKGNQGSVERSPFGPLPAKQVPQPSDGLGQPMYNADRIRQGADRQIEMNRARTPTQRFEALCDLLDVVREMSPTDAHSVERRTRLGAARQQQRTKLIEFCRRHIAARRADAQAGLSGTDCHAQ